MKHLDAALASVTSQQSAALADLIEFSAIPSISTLSERNPDTRRAAQWVVAKLNSIGMEHAQLFETDRHPVVYADWLHAPGKPTILLYGHYDVQPADPLAEWNTDPFTPTQRGDNLYARGASDMKAQVLTLIRSVGALLAAGSLAVNLKFLIEGEEEIGSPSLSKFIPAHASRLQCDYMVSADSGILKPDIPSIVYGLRGLAYFELWVQGPQTDLHSGMFGGVVHNPANVLARLIAGMHDSDGHILLPGFYDDVVTLDPAERAVLAATPYTDADVLAAAANPPQLYGERGFSSAERIGARPTLDVNGMLSGFTGEGSKTALPAKSMAKISTRLVPNQDPAKVATQMRAYLAQHAPPSVRWTLNLLSGAHPAVVDRNSPGMQAAVRAMHTVFGKAPVLVREGGSVPIVGLMRTHLNIDTVMLGFALHDDGIHGPNEKQHIPTFWRGIETFVHFFSNAAQ